MFSKIYKQLNSNYSEIKKEGSPLEHGEVQKAILICKADNDNDGCVVMTRRSKSHEVVVRGTFKMPHDAEAFAWQLSRQM